MKINFQPKMNINSNFKGFEKDFSLEQVRKTYPMEIVDKVIEEHSNELGVCESVNIGFFKDAFLYGQTHLGIKTSVPFDVIKKSGNTWHNLELEPESIVFVNSNTAGESCTDGKGNLIVHVGVGGVYNIDNPYALKLPFRKEDIAREAKYLLNKLRVLGGFDHKVPDLALVMEASTKQDVQSVIETLKTLVKKWDPKTTLSFFKMV